MVVNVSYSIGFNLEVVACLGLAMITVIADDADIGSDIVGGMGGEEF